MVGEECCDGPDCCEDGDDEENEDMIGCEGILLAVHIDKVGEHTECWDLGGQVLVRRFTATGASLHLPV